MNTKTALIVPAITDQAGQCRIVMRDGGFSDPLRAYRASPEQWREVGLMNSRGRLVCLEAIPGLREELYACEPLRAGLAVQWQSESATLPA